ncbi:MASE1 domain-containing protein [Methylomonas sp. OY6]|uniref:MASE1 domain-containing protein n=1 Tax=Methylomonas defluvii TaxID=3045149 RepID=A0ABU4UKK4_9GAMM|nr:MASE1 domain-containing protein [Methylomonas sp. OY6]MDX8130011.1 MASE1 domain-containing protein [Methylomonas sp. OY6]
MIVLRLIALVIVIFLSGWLGLKMAVPPGYASPLWPPAGFALAAMMLWGRKLWPAILIGSMANEFLAGYLANANFTPAVLISFCLISLGSTLQACVGHWLSATLIGPGVPKLDNARQTLLFFSLTGPLSCLIAASVGVCSIIAVDLLPKSQIASAWLNWWVGDSLGVLIVCPLVFCVFALPREIWRARRIQVALPLLATLLALALVFIQVYQAEKIRIQMIFDNQADKIDRLLIEYGNNIIDNALTIKGLYMASNQVTRHQFGLFTQSILERHPEIQALEWLPRVRQDQLSQFESTVQAEGYPHFKVVEQTIDGSLRAVENRAEYFPITFVEPMKGNERAIVKSGVQALIKRRSGLCFLLQCHP